MMLALTLTLTLTLETAHRCKQSDSPHPTRVRRGLGSPMPPAVLLLSEGLSCRQYGRRVERVSLRPFLVVRSSGLI